MDSEDRCGQGCGHCQKVVCGQRVMCEDAGSGQVEEAGVKIHWGRFAALAVVVVLLIAAFAGGLLRALLGLGLRFFILALVIGLLFAGFHRVKRALVADDDRPENR